MIRRLSGTFLISLAFLAAGCGHNDQQVAAGVQNKINADSTFPDKGLQVTASNGVITLSGNVSSEAAREAAAKDAAQVEGVKTVVNNLVVSGTAAAATAPAPPQNPQVDNTAPPAPVPAPRAKPSPRVSSASRSSHGNYSSASRSDNGDVTVNTVPSPGNAGQDNSSNLADNSSVAPAPPPQAVAPPPPAPVTVPSGTQFSIRLDSELNSETAQVGDLFRASISTPIAIDGNTVIPVGALVEGRVVDVKSAGRFAGQSDLVLELTRVRVGDQGYPIATDHWSKSGSSRGKATAAKVGGGTAVGAILGGIFGGGKGAAIGAAAGAGAGTGVSAAGKGQQIDLKPETVLSFQLENSIAVVPAAQSRPALGPNGQNN